MGNDIKVSVCIPIYGVEKYVERCARSLFEQTMTDGIEFIFINDCTKDKSIEILDQVLAEYPQRKDQVKIICHEQNGGIGTVRITALRAARGTYIWYVDSDDYVAVDAVEILYNTAVSQKADIVMMNFADVFMNDKICECKRPELKKDDLLSQILRGDFLPGVVLNFCAKKLYDDNNINFIPKINMGEDYMTTPRLVYFGEKIVSLNAVLYFYCHDNSENYCNIWKNSYLEQRDLIYSVLNKFFEDKNPKYLSDIKQHIIRSKCQFYRIYATAKHSNYDDLLKINNWHKEISSRILIKNAQLPYVPIIILAYLRMDFLLKCYAGLCKYIYHKLVK